ncbi:FMN-dependent NADH-azoreductase [Rubricella aquisinus]|uniref:FMN dependent NADH:quinone oxidoreductase n=1 Tax=Rubricella aquisinus TaxID=2028108 RepID=A0A840WP22_9RHOB|nr:NAD(P)H-dependent oxidoreductase [Rubricella aquisinus]MBB5516809.1 FMN-dependent NADH-azoreductase [Rubricella aquisinus]
MTTLLIQSSARTVGSTSRDLSALLAERLGAPVVTRDVSAGLPMVSADWIAANVTEADARTDAQKAELAQSDELIAEVEAADTLVIAVPLYNFSIPASLKSWIDQIARARRTFRYTENGPEGLLKGKRAFLVVTSGGVPVDAPVDFATPYLRHVLSFIGITDVTVIGADRQMANPDAVDAARAQIEALTRSQAA